MKLWSAAATLAWPLAMDKEECWKKPRPGRPLLDAREGKEAKYRLCRGADPGEKTLTTTRGSVTQTGGAENVAVLTQTGVVVALRQLRCRSLPPSLCAGLCDRASSDIAKALEVEEHRGVCGEQLCRGRILGSHRVNRLGWMNVHRGTVTYPSGAATVLDPLAGMPVAPYSVQLSRAAKFHTRARPSTARCGPPPLVREINSNNKQFSPSLPDRSIRNLPIEPSELFYAFIRMEFHIHFATNEYE